MKTYLVKKQWMAGLVIVFMLMGSALFASDEKKPEEKAKGYLGVSIDRISLKDKKDLGITHGVLVTSVQKESAAEKAGIEEDDIIQFFNDTKIKVPGDLTDAVRETAPGTKATVKIVRVDKPMTLNVTLGKLESRRMLSWTDKDMGKKFKFFSDKGKDFDSDIDVFKVHAGGYLGVQMQELNDDLAAYFGVKADGGALVMSVTKESPAEKAGFKSGDVIIELDGKAVSSPADVAKAIGEKEKDEDVSVKIMRHKKSQTLKAKLEARKGFGEFRIFKGKDGNTEEMEFLRAPHHNMWFQSNHPGNIIEKIIIGVPGMEEGMEMPHIFIDGQKGCCEIIKHKECVKEEKKDEENKDLDKVKKKKRVKIVRESLSI